MPPKKNFQQQDLNSKQHRYPANDYSLRALKSLAARRNIRGVSDKKKRHIIHLLEANGQIFPGDTTPIVGRNIAPINIEQERKAARDRHYENARKRIEQLHRAFRPLHLPDERHLLDLQYDEFDSDGMPRPKTPYNFPNYVQQYQTQETLPLHQKLNFSRVLIDMIKTTSNVNEFITSVYNTYYDIPLRIVDCLIILWNIYHKQPCIICLEKFQFEEDLIRTKCNHVFHKECISLWPHANCPTCRTQNPFKNRVIEKPPDPDLL
jgi:hypothetical protein